MKKKLLFLLRLLLISLLLFSCVDWIGRVYQAVLYQVTAPFLSSGEGAIRLDYISYLRIVPFLALMLATPGISIRRRSVLILLGMTVFMVFDAVSNMVWGGFPGKESTPIHVVFTLIWQVTGQWIFPFLFWFIAVYKNLGELFSDGVKAPAQ